MKQSGLQACIYADGNIFDIDFKYVWLLHYTVTRLNAVNRVHFMFSGELARFAVTSAGVDKFYWNLVIVCD